jgi:hypothetical protein
MTPDAGQPAPLRRVPWWAMPFSAGAWAVHGTAGLALLLLAPWVVDGLTTLQGRLARRMLR